MSYTPSSSISTVRLMNVLFVPQLGHNLISWNVLRSRFICEMGGKDVFVNNKDGSLGTGR